MRIYPAIDMKAGRAVRLYKGLESELTDYGNPLQAAERWIGEGASFLHLVDLDGAFSGEGKNLDAVAAIAKLGVPVQLGGGIRTMEGIQRRFDLGVTRVILGTVAVENPQLVEEACARYPGRIVCGIDANNGEVALRGWVKGSGVSAVELATQMKNCGVCAVIYTDISRDGTLEGPNLAATKGLIEQSGLDVIGSGGVGSMADLAALGQIGCEGAIVGKAIYSGAIALKDALKLEEA